MYSACIFTAHREEKMVSDVVSNFQAGLTVGAGMYAQW
jgi:hypothetical protein